MSDFRCGDSSVRSRNSPRLPVENATSSGISRALRPRNLNASFRSSRRPAKPVLLHVGRRLHEERLEVAREPGEPAFHREEALAVGGRELLEQRAHARGVAPPRQHGAVGRHGLHGRLGRDHLQSVTVEREVADHLGPQHARHVGRGRDAAARRFRGVDFLGDGATAEHVAALEHERLESRAREVERGRQPVVPTADDDDVVSIGNRHIAGPGTIGDPSKKRPSRKPASRAGSAVPLTISAISLPAPGPMPKPWPLKPVAR